MRLLAQILLIALLIVPLNSILAKKGNSEVIKGKERLKKYDIPFTEESFFKYLMLDNADVVEDFLLAGYSPDMVDGKFDPLLLIAAENNLIDAAEVLLKFGANPNLGDLDKTTPLMYACYNQNTKMVKILLKFKADINLQNRCGSTALMFAIKGGNGSTIDEVLTKQTDLSLKNDKGHTAKDLAISMKYFYLANYMEEKVDFLNGRYEGKEKFNTIKLREL